VNIVPVSHEFIEIQGLEFEKRKVIMNLNLIPVLRLLFWALILQSLLAKANQLEKHSSLRAAFHSYWNVEKAREGNGG
jgi:D-hexose-6-phosphate mutarotase